MGLAVGDRVRVDIADPADPDHRFHDKTGEVVEITQDDLGELFDDPRLNYLITVAFDEEALGTMTFRAYDLVAID